MTWWMDRTKQGGADCNCCIQTCKRQGRVGPLAPLRVGASMIYRTTSSSTPNFFTIWKKQFLKKYFSWYFISVMISKIQILFPAVGNINDGGCAGTRSASVFLRKAGGCNFLVANPTNHLFTAFHSDVISYKPNACYGSFEALKEQCQVRWDHRIIEQARAVRIISFKVWSKIYFFNWSRWWK